MCVIYNTQFHYILVLKYWDSGSGKVCGDKYMYRGKDSRDVFCTFKRFFFDSTFDLNHLFIVSDDGTVHRSTWKTPILADGFSVGKRVGLKVIVGMMT